MSNTAANVVVATNGKVWVGDVGDEFPTDAETALDGSSVGGYLEVGFISEDGATFTMSQDITDIGAWQSLMPLRSIVTGRDITLTFAMREWNETTIEFALGGTVSDGVYSPPAPDEIVERSLALDWIDGDKNYRLFVPRGLVTDTVEFQLVRTAAADLNVTFKVLDPGDDSSDEPIDAFTIFSNDPALGFSS